MKATGIVRRVDDLGRVVIPKEIRRNLRIRIGEPLEIYTDKEGGIILKKYSPLGEVNEFSAQYADSITDTSGIPVAVCDLDTVIAVSGTSKRECLDRPVSSELLEMMEKRQCFSYTTASQELSISDYSDVRVSYMCPIVSEGSVVGAIMSLKTPNRTGIDEIEKKLINTGATFLAKQMAI